MDLLREIVTNLDDLRDTWTSVVKVVSEVDALIRLAIASQGDGTGSMARPVVLPNCNPLPVLESAELGYPVLAAKWDCLCRQ